MNFVWLMFLGGAVCCAIYTGHVREVVISVTESAESAFKLALGLTGIMALWLGIMRIAQESGLVERTTHLVLPLLRILFPRIPPGHPAFGSMAMNIVANVLGLNNAATPFGLKAMEDLDSLNVRKGTATDEMCMFLAINTSSVQLIPAAVIGLLAAGGSSDPTLIVLPTIVATTFSTLVAVMSAKLFGRLSYFQVLKKEEPTGE